MAEMPKYKIAPLRDNNGAVWHGVYTWRGNGYGLLHTTVQMWSDEGFPNMAVFPSFDEAKDYLNRVIAGGSNNGLTMYFNAMGKPVERTIIP